MNERNEIRTANAGYEQALQNMMLDKNRIKGPMDTDLLNLYVDFLDEVMELFNAIRAEGNDRVAEEAGDCIAYLSRMIEVIKYGSEI